MQKIHIYTPVSSVSNPGVNFPSLIGSLLYMMNWAVQLGSIGFDGRVMAGWLGAQYTIAGGE